MAHESFEDAATAAVMNRLFVNIKVDREERPDVDQIYMAALHALGEQGGWPLTMFLTPDGEPIWGGTYFPKTARYGRPAFVDVLEEVARLFRDEPDKIATNRALHHGAPRRDARRRRRRRSTAPSSTTPPTASSASWTRTTAASRGAPKFPQASLLEFLWRAGVRTGDARYRDAVLAHAPQHRAGRHLRPHRRRLRPLLGRRALARAAFREDALRQRPAPRAADLRLARDRRPAVPRPIEETVAWLDREMLLPGGAFAASLDADSEGHEGSFYVWTPRRGHRRPRRGGGRLLRRRLRHHRRRQLGGRLDPQPPRAPARSSTPTTKRASPPRARSSSRAAQTASAPATDDKILADWNGLMIAALAFAGATFDRPDWIALAARRVPLRHRRR